MQHLFRIIMISILPLVAAAQQENISGRWTGLLKQDGRAWSFIMSAEILQTGETINGMVKCIAPDGTYSLITIDGKKDGNTITFADRAVMEETISSPQLRLCIKLYSGTLSTTNTKWTIQGSWQNNGTKSFSNGRYFENNFSCVPGTFNLEKTMENISSEVSKPGVVKDSTVFLNRKIEVQKRFSVSSDSLYLAFYDNGTVDGDTISVFLNKQPIVTKQRLTASPLRVAVKLVADKDNEIIMFAENVGTIPPNTALLVFFDKQKRYEVTIDSDNGKNGTIVISKNNEQ
jgi:hypothetical protein